MHRLRDEKTRLEAGSSPSNRPREGQRHAPVFVKRIVDRNGKPVAEFGAPTRRALSADVALDLTDMPRGVDEPAVAVPRATHPAPPPVPVAPPTLPPAGPPGWDGGIAAHEPAPPRANGLAPAPAYVTAPRARAPRFERSARPARDGDDEHAERPLLPRWQTAIPVPRARAGRDREDDFERDRGGRDGAELLRDAPDVHIDFDRRERWRGPATRSNFGIAPDSRSGPPADRVRSACHGPDRCHCGLETFADHVFRGATAYVIPSTATAIHAGGCDSDRR